MGDFGGGEASPEIPPFWPVTATYVAVTGQKKLFLEGLRPSKPPALAGDRVTRVKVSAHAAYSV